MSDTVVTQLHEVRASDLTRADWAKIVWAFSWRGLCVSLASAVAGGLGGFVIGFVGGLGMSGLGVSSEGTRLGVLIVSALLGLLLSFYFITLYVRWLLGARFRYFRLALVRVSA